MAQMPVRPATKSKKHLVLGGVGAGVLLVLAVLLFGPVLSVSTWKSDMRDSTDKAITAANRTNKDLDLYSSKLNLTPEDESKYIDLLKTQIKNIESAKNDVKPIGGIPGIDVTGSHKKATDTRDKLIKSYDQYLDMLRVELARSSAQHEAGLAMQRANDGTETDVKAAIKSIRDAATKYEAFATGANGSQIDKDMVSVLKQLAASIEKMDGVTDPYVANEALTEYNDAMERVDDLQVRGHEDNKNREKKADAIVDELNKLSKELE